MTPIFIAHWNRPLNHCRPQVFLIDFMPPLKLIFGRYENRSKELFDEFIELEMRLYREARETFEPGQVSIKILL